MATIDATLLRRRDIGQRAPPVAHALLRRSPELFADVTEELRKETLGEGELREWIAYWRKNPIAAWTAERRERRAWFRLDGDRFVLELEIEEGLGGAFGKLVRELVDYRLAQYRARRRQDVPAGEGFVCKVMRNERDPILKLPDRARVALPEGETDVRLADGAVWQFRFVKEYCNVARPAGTERNQLPDLLRGWFGPHAGKAGTAFLVRFHAGPDGLWVEPEQAAVIELASRRKVVAYPDLRAAAGHAGEAAEPPGDELVWLPLEDASPDMFAVRVSGTSMDGGKEPLRDGDWAVMRVARSLPASAVENRVVLVETGDSSFGAQYQIKRLRRRGAGWQLPRGRRSRRPRRWCRSRGWSERSGRRVWGRRSGRCSRRMSSRRGSVWRVWRRDLIARVGTCSSSWAGRACSRRRTGCGSRRSRRARRRRRSC